MFLSKLLTTFFPYSDFCLRSSTQVSLKAREVLISCQMPSYEERRAQMEGILKSSVTNSYYGEQGADIRLVKFPTMTTAVC